MLNRHGQYDSLTHFQIAEETVSTKPPEIKKNIEIRLNIDVM